MILIDGSALTYKSFHGNVRDIIQDNQFNKDYFKHILISSILWKAKLLGASKSNKVVICSDSKPYWRTEYFNSVKHEYFKDYYLTEKTKKEIDIENYTYKGKRAKMDPELSKNIWDVHTDVINFFNSYTDFHELKVKSAEADDIMAVLAKQFADLGEDVYLVGGDKDFKQLLSNPKIHFYNDSPFRKQGMSEWFECENPEEFAKVYTSWLNEVGDKTKYEVILPVVKRLQSDPYITTEVLQITGGSDLSEQFEGGPQSLVIIRTPKSYPGL